MANIEDRIEQIGLRLFANAAKFRHGWSRRAMDTQIMQWAMRDAAVKTQLFRFVDVLPMLATHDALLAHLREYLCDANMPFPVLGETGRNGLRFCADNRWLGPLLAAVVRAQVSGMARTFIAGSNVREAAATARRLRMQRMAFTLDILGEVTVSDRDARVYQQQYMDLIDGLTIDAARWPDDPLLDQASGHSIPIVNISLKLSALCPRVEPADPAGTAAEIISSLRPILRRAKERGAFVNVDMEHYAVKDVTLHVLRQVLLDPEFRDWPHLGMVLQAYLRDTERDAAKLFEVLRDRPAPVTIRLVKGAYWDYETAIAAQRQWPVPVFTRKCETDASYERLTAMLLDQYPRVHLAVASHNIRSIAAAMARADALGLPPDAVEYQVLYGMADQLKHAVRAEAQRLRVYVPYGPLIPGMAYLVRRLLENTANDSFLRQGFTEGRAPRELLRNPAKLVTANAPVTVNEPEGFRNIPERDFAQEEPRQRMRAALQAVRGRFGQLLPLIINGKAVVTGRDILSRNPAHPDEVVGRVASAGRDEAQRAVDAAQSAAAGWRNTPARERATLLRRAADQLTTERDELAALQVFEVGKNWREADADVCETIDYLRYYAAEMERLAPPRALMPLPGETNLFRYAPKGLAVILPPWNFPMAICAGMTSAALVAGNTVILKPASESPCIAAAFVDALHRAGLPPGILNFLPGPGEEVGEFLVRHPAVHLIAFTGSREVGCRINRLAAEVEPGQRHLKKVIAEMGGKNAIIVDVDADLDEAVLGTVQSAFGYQGQKCSACSRVIVLEPVYDAFVARLLDAAGSVTIGPPDTPGNWMGPVVSARAQKGILDYIKRGKTEATLALQREVKQPEGYFVGPTIFTGVPPTAVIAREEIFGPVLAVMKARTLEEAITLALDVDYALTGGIYTRTPSHIARAARDFAVGNLYINRKITGAIVGRQPFGGFRLSGIGSKAGGPDYLLQFLDPRTITENTMRRGFAPEGES